MNEEFQKIYENYSKEIYIFLLKMVGFRKDVAEELTQETFYQVFISLHRYRGECDIKTWICQIAKNSCFKYYKKNPIQISLQSDDFNESDLKEIVVDPEEYLERMELAELLRAYIIKLKPKYRDVLTFRLYFGTPFKQIGSLLHINENSAKVIYYRGREMIKRMLKETYYGE